jgi:hypothetical protein
MKLFGSDHSQILRVFRKLNLGLDEWAVLYAKSTCYSKALKSLRNLQYVRRPGPDLGCSAIGWICKDRKHSTVWRHRVHKTGTSHLTLRYERCIGTGHNWRWSFSSCQVLGLLKSWVIIPSLYWMSYWPSLKMIKTAFGNFFTSIQSTLLFHFSCMIIHNWFNFKLQLKINSNFIQIVGTAARFFLIDALCLMYCKVMLDNKMSLLKSNEKYGTTIIHIQYWVV